MTELSEDDIQNLRGKLSALAEHGEAYDEHARQMDVADSASVKTAIIREIDDCILAVDVTFKLDGKTLHLQVSERRLLSVMSLHGIALSDVEGSFFGQQLSPDDEAGLDNIVRCINALAQSTGKMSIHYERIDALTDESVGVTAEQISSLLTVEEDAQPASPSIASSIENVLASLELESGEIVKSDGTKEQVAALTEITGGKLGHFLANTADTDQASCAYFADLVADLGSLAVVVHGEKASLLLMPNGSENEFHQAWHATK